jgi:predicted DNA-binding transcriptional regulator YafY
VRDLRFFEPFFVIHHKSDIHTLKPASMSLLERIYFFHQRIVAKRYPTSGDIAEKFEVSPATAHRDIAYLRDRLLAPLCFDQQRNGYYYEEDNFRLPFENNPRVLLFLGMLGEMAKETGLERLPEVEQLQARLSRMTMGGNGSLTDLVYCEWVEVEPVNNTIFTTILTALTDQQQLAISYRSGSGELSKRSIEPLKLINYQGRWYLLAFCLLRQDRRLFHLARIDECNTLAIDCKHQIKQGDEYLSGVFGIFKGKATATARIRCTGKAAEIIRHQRWHSEQTIEEVDQGIILSLPVADDRELIMKVLQFGHDVELIEPESMRLKVVQEIEKMTELYSTA